MDKLRLEIPKLGTIQPMKEIECALCGWNWIMFDAESDDDCPFCPREVGGYVFTTH